jgi:hypothetical protein
MKPKTKKRKPRTLRGWWWIVTPDPVGAPDLLLQRRKIDAQLGRQPGERLFRVFIEGIER